MTNNSDKVSNVSVGAVVPSENSFTKKSEYFVSDFRDRLVYCLGITLSVFMLWVNVYATLPDLWVRSIHFAGFAFLVTLIIPTYKNRKNSWAVFGIDLLVGLAVVASVVYLIAGEQAFYDRGSEFVAADWIFSIICILAAIELTRRTTGWIIPGLILFSLTYVVWWGKYVGGIFNFSGLSAETILFRQYYGDGMFGDIAGISASFVFMFILFGAFLVKSGAGNFIIQLALAIAGRWVGGPGLVAVFGSAFMGSISGSAVANTVSTGVMTIPMMKRAGFPPKFAAGVEAAASTGGQLMPPVMGAGAFIMSNYTQVSYVEIISVALLPAVLYFLSVAFWVRIEAVKIGLTKKESGGSDAVDLEGECLPEIPQFWQVLRNGGHHLLPLAVLVYLLIMRFPPTYAAGISIIAVIVTSWLSQSKMGLKAIMEALADGARSMASVAVLLVAVGIIVNVIVTTGIGNTFSIMISNWAGGSLLLTIILVALASLILGMGLPVTAAYIVLATLSAPAIKDLIIHAELINMLVDNQIPESMFAMWSMFAGESASLLGQPMTEQQAAQIIANVPPDFLANLTEKSLSSTTVTAALLSAHMVVYWLSQDSNVTPPVCLTAFAAAAIAKTPPMATGVMSWKIAKGLYIVPLIIAYTPFLYGTWLEVAEIFFASALGIYALTGVIDGYLETRLNSIQRSILLISSILLFWPHNYVYHIFGMLMFLSVMILSIKGKAKSRQT